MHIFAMSYLGKTCFRTLHGNMVRMLTYMVVHVNPHVPTCKILVAPSEVRIGRSVVIGRPG